MHIQHRVLHQSSAAVQKKKCQLQNQLVLFPILLDKLLKPAKTNLGAFKSVNIGPSE